MPSIKYKQNQLIVVLSATGKGDAMVLRNDGTSQPVKFLGFIERDVALRSAGARPVKIGAVEYAQSNDPFPLWLPLKQNEAIQGCYLSGQGVFGVTIDGAPRIVTRTNPEAPYYIDIPPFPEEERYHWKGKWRRRRR